MVEVRTYTLPPTRLIPNSPMPLLHYPGFFSKDQCTPGNVSDIFTSNGWQTQWLTRYGPTQASHYHSSSHECMAVLSGTAKIRFGVADSCENEKDYDSRDEKKAEGVEVLASAGDVFVLPAGLAHKTFDPSPMATFLQLLPGDGHFIDAPDRGSAIRLAELSGFTMIGAYPNGSTWDFMTGGESEVLFDDIWSVPVPNHDPVLGTAQQGLHGLWQGQIERNMST